MTHKELEAIFQATHGAAKTINNALAALAYTMEHLPKPQPITDEEFQHMWSNALGRMLEGSATIVQARHLLTLIEAHYGIQRQ